MTRNADIPMAKSLVDYIFRWLAMEFVPGYRAANAPKRTKPGARSHEPVSPSPLQDESRSADDSTPVDAPEPVIKRNGNGHGRHLTPDAKPITASPLEAEDRSDGSELESQVTVAPRLAAYTDPLSQQGTNMQADAPACDVCGSITVRSGTCYKCLNCGNSMGCS